LAALLANYTITIALRAAAISADFPLRGHPRVTKARRLVANTMLAARRSDDVRHLFAPLATLTALQPSNNFVVMGNDATAEVRVVGTALSEVTMASPLA